jgi:hypothetical protein
MATLVDVVWKIKWFYFSFATLLLKSFIVRASSERNSEHSGYLLCGQMYKSYDVNTLKFEEK